MTWNLDFNYCAIILFLVLIVIYYSKATAPLKRNRTFSILILVAFGATVLDVVTSWTVMYSFEFPRLFSELSFYFYFLFEYLIAVCYVNYVITWTGTDIFKKKVWLVFYMIPLCLLVIFIGSNPITSWIFTFESGYYERGPYQFLLIGFILYYILFGLAYELKFGELITRGKKVVINMFVIISVVAAIVQYCNRELLVSNFSVAVALMMIYFLAQNHGEIFDNKTDIFNRDLFSEYIAIELKSNHRFNVIVLAMDDFKFINKTFGLTTGDRMLMQVANYLKCFHKKGIAFRFGADQFCLVLPESAGDLEDMAGIIMERFRHPFIDEGVGVMMSSTVCCISCPKDASTAEEAIDVIDYAVLTSKIMGKGSVVYAKDIDLDKLREEKAIEKAIKLAIDRDTFEVHYQPIYDTVDGKFTCAEALVRLNDDILGNIPPDVFIPIAEHNGTIVTLGEKIFEKVCKFISENNLERFDIKYIEVNVSVVQCMQLDFVDRLLDIMSKYHVDANMINLEITETAAINSANILRDNINKLYEKGIRFSLDDYGSGYSTLGYINQLPFSIIKLDKLIVWDAFENNRAYITLKYTVGMLKELDVHIVAEGVETLEQQKNLETMGCNFLQGWYYSKAIPPEDFVAFIMRNTSMVAATTIS